MSGKGVMKRWRWERRNRKRKREEGTRRKKGSYLSVCHGPPCITSLRCFSTDDIVGLGGGGTGPRDDVINNQSENSGPVESGRLLRLN